MNDETPINEDNAAIKRKRQLPGPVEAAGFELQERLIWPLQDRFGNFGSGPNRTALLGGGAAVFLAGVAIVFALTSGGGSSAPPKTQAQAPPPREPLASTVTPAQPEAQTKQEPPRETLHGAAPVFSPPSPASKGGDMTGKSKAAAAETPTSDASAASDASSDDTAASEAGGADESTGSSTSSSPAAARISSDPENSEATKTDAGPAANEATAARAAVADGPPAGAAALKVAREFAEGFVVYETGGEKSAFKGAFAASATPELTKALLQRPPKQPAGLKVPRAKVLNVVAGPSQGKVYKVSVSLLRVGVTSELRLDMEKIKTAGEQGKRVEWRVTNVLG
jgi:hypothetical protein